jgi:predicted metal-dependent HD superfamily phosphohydrolase
MTSKPGRYGIEDSLTLSWFQPGYWKTLANLRAIHPDVAIEGSALRFAGYPFEPATVYPTGTVEVDLIAEVNLGSPSQVRLKGGDILFVTGAGKEALITFINQNDLQIVHRSSVWSALLDPFLDTWEEQESIDRQFVWLANLGLDRDAVDKWRREVAVAMVAYNFGMRLWKWTSLGLYDVLVAQRARLTRTAFADFYSRAMHLAEIDPVSPGWSPSTCDNVASALFAVLIDWYPREKGGAVKHFLKQWDMRSDQIERLRQKLVAELTSAYSESHRRYHTLAHIEKCLMELGNAWHYAVHLNEVRWGLLFHDAIYDPRRQDNEARSADWACRVMDELHRSEEEKARVRAMILATAHSCEPQTADEALLLDVDLSILGADEATFDEYDRSIRAEYEWVPEDSYRKARAKVLESFANRERLYQTALYRRRCEPSARMNIERALARLRAP